MIYGIYSVALRAAGMAGVSEVSLWLKRNGFADFAADFEGKNINVWYGYSLQAFYFV